MSYESGMLVRRQQREYPPELRQEIALTALEVGNNREVARLYSERLGYTVNESTVRGIKKRYLECLSRNGEPAKEGEEKEEEEEEVQPANVMKLQLDILGTDTRMLQGVGTVEVMEAVHGDDAMEEDNTIETNGSESGEANGLSINGDDSNDSFVNQLSIDTGDTSTEASTPNKPTIRIAKGLHKSPDLNLQKSRSVSPAKLNMKRKSTTSSNGLASKKLRPSVAESEADIASLEKEVRALQWLARRKEQEWDQAVRLLKQKEEKLIKALRNKSLVAMDTEPAKIRLSVDATPTLVQPQPVIIPQQQVMILPQQPASRIVAPKIAQVVRPAVATSPTVVRSSKSPSPASRPAQPERPFSNNSASSASGDLSEAKFATVLQKASKNLQKAASQGKKEEKKNTPQCQGCGKKKSEFVCAGCSNRWYCSRECQVEDWDEHADECAG